MGMGCMGNLCTFQSNLLEIKSIKKINDTHTNKSAVDIGSDKWENLRNLALYLTSKLTSSVYLKKIMAPALNGVICRELTILD